MPKATLILSLCLLILALLLSPSPALSKEKSNQPIILITGPETTDFLDELGKPLLEAAGISAENVQFHVLLDTSLNAMALESNDIVFNSGLLLAADTVDEIAGVMAHEIAHLSSGHHIKLKSEVDNVSLQTLLFGLAGVAAGVVSGNGEVAQATIIGGTAAGQARLLSGQRQKETQADRLAIYYLAKAGFEPMGLSYFMERIQREQRENAMPPPYLLSHPLSSDRLVEIRQMAKEIRPKVLRKQTNLELFHRVQAKLLASSAATPDMIVHHFQARLDTHPEDPIARYGIAVAQRYTGQLPESEAHLTHLLIKQPNDPHLLRERGRTRMDWGKAALAEEDFQAALKFRPESQDLRYWLAFALNEQKKYQPASRILRRLTTEYPKQANYFYLLGMVEGKNSRVASGHLALGRYYKLIRERKTAIWHFDEAMRLASPGALEREIAQGEKSRLVALMEEKNK
ncbi:MAG: M48 family metalloprotease [Magnetococcales bacterium]|nr:M48 family metalloprotease [Magnetococcales bacterium]